MELVATPTGTPGPFVLAIGLFVGAFIAAMIGKSK